MSGVNSVRSNSRRRTSTPQSHQKPISRSRFLRSTSRDVEEVPKAARRSARQTSIASTMTDESDRDVPKMRRGKRKTVKEPPGDLATVEEIDTQFAHHIVPGTPTRDEADNPLPFQSPGVASEMSGTTAISSFSMVEAEFLAPKYILKHLRKLCDSSEEFLEHVAPSTVSSRGNSFDIDIQNMRDIQQPDSEFSQDYRDFDTELGVHLHHFKSEEHNYIHVRAIHRALFGSNADIAAAQSGLDLILYLTNLLIFAKQMIHSDRNEKYTWDVLRQLDNSFPNNFMQCLGYEDQPITSGGSMLLNPTYELALDLRTQLAILVLQRSLEKDNDELDELIDGVFFRPESSQQPNSFVLRGWNVSPDMDKETLLPQELQEPVMQRIQDIKGFFFSGTPDLDNAARLEQLASDFPWEATVMRILDWTRHRHRELETAKDEFGGVAGIVCEVKRLIESPFIAPSMPVTKMLPESPRKKRASFERVSKRHSRNFDPNAPVDVRTIDALKARERATGAGENIHSATHHVEDMDQEDLQQVPSDPPIADELQDNWQPVLENEEESVDEHEIRSAEDGIDETQEGPPINSQALLKTLKEVNIPQKENHPARNVFERQEGAVSIDFGDGFEETQATPGPSQKRKEGQPADPPRKRQRSVEDEDEDEEDEFETADRGAHVQQRRQQASVTKKVRLDLASSGAPPSHQPSPRRHTRSLFIPEQGDSLSEEEAPNMTEEVPSMTEEAPSSTYDAQRCLALQNSSLARVDAFRKPRTTWSNQEEEAFVEYMSMYPAKYAQILLHDASEGGGILQHRTQVNLKDKARTMAINMIKSRTGLMSGFETIVKYGTKDGKRLIRDGYDW